MKNTFIHNKSIALFITFVISVITFKYWLSAKAQNTSSTAKAPTYTRLQDAKNFQIKGKGKAFLPKNLQQTNKPEQADDSEFRRRGVIGWDDRIPMLSRKYPWSVALSKKKTMYYCMTVTQQGVLPVVQSSVLLVISLIFSL